MKQEKAITPAALENAYTRLACARDMAQAQLNITHDRLGRARDNAYDAFDAAFDAYCSAGAAMDCFWEAVASGDYAAAIATDMQMGNPYVCRWAIPTYADGQSLRLRQNQMTHQNKSKHDDDVSRGLRPILRKSAEISPAQSTHADSMRAEIMRLTEAGDAMDKYLARQDGTTNGMLDCRSKWHAAKEGKTK